MIDIDQVRRLNVQDGDLLVVPENSEDEGMQQLCEALRYLIPDGKVIIVRGPIEQLDVGDMNKLGWHRA
ncbi:hypothetical protein [Pseudomonas sp. BC115LW]|uniref:hypothetical protein n=1 Tax=Pseudomonas sp. BC115LW TaxID=2683267 RepID=UPI00141362ED|nr:hypothetical protein [Pseudomonas sp. BC115LW]NBB33778.1 hypothetical protein [Pseudomonas sp. BC115LW]